MQVPAISFSCKHRLATERLSYPRPIFKTLVQTDTPSVQQSMLHAIGKALRSPNQSHVHVSQAFFSTSRCQPRESATTLNFYSALRSLKINKDPGSNYLVPIVPFFSHPTSVRTGGRVVDNNRNVIISKSCLVYKYILTSV